MKLTCTGYTLYEAAKPYIYCKRYDEKRILMYNVNRMSNLTSQAHVCTGYTPYELEWALKLMSTLNFIRMGAEGDLFVILRG